jgi:hypothetical protein
MGKRIGVIAGGVAAVVALVLVGFLGWANTPMMGERPAAMTAWTDSSVQIRDAGAAVVMSPTGRSSGEGLVFVPGARVDPYAYLYTLSGVVGETGLTVVITKPTLNLAFFDTRPLSTFTATAPAVTTWAVGGHSLGGVRACQLADDPAVSRLILFGSYCADDLSGAHLAALSIGGENDGLSTPAKIAGAAHLLPSDATFVEVPGMTHAQFGAYGLQPGDGTATISDAEARDAITAALASVL